MFARLNIIAVLCSLLASTAGATDTRLSAAIPVDLELLLAVDISYSVDEDEARQQRKGHVEALADPAVINAIRGGTQGRVAIAYMEWADANSQRMVADWTLIESEADALAFAALVNAAPFERGHYTAIGSALEYGLAGLVNNPFEGQRKVIDISGDGPQNQGTPLAQAREKAMALGVTVNGLPVITVEEGPWARAKSLDLESYFRDNVITGTGAFVMPARGSEYFKDALIRKLILEIAGLDPSLSPHAVLPAP